ncbi:ribosome-associated ATPase/putative transporter RbbA [beta proteobacterium MWH-UniP1]
MNPEQYVAKLSNVRLLYGQKIALDVADLKIPTGCITGLIGPDGVGKSSLLALVAGVRRIQSGEVETLGHDLRQGAQRRAVTSRIAFMPQGLGKNLYMRLTVAENIEFFGRLFGQTRAERRARIDELLSSTELTKFRDRAAGKLSGGMKQKLGLCCALVHDPDLLILDEPTTGVDPLSRLQFWRLIERIRARHPRMSVVVSSAYMEEAARFDWLIAMNAGQVLAQGSPSSLIEQTGTSNLDDAFIELLPKDQRISGPARTTQAEHHQPNPEIAIRAKGLTKRFGSFTAVDRVSFEIHRGEIFGFLGSNGCGKTTTMKMLTGLTPPTEGQAWLFGETTDAHGAEIRKRVGYMTQSFSLYTELTVAQNLTLHGQLFGLTSEKIQSRAQQLMQRFDLGEYADRHPMTLPLGVRQRLSLAVALIHEPEILILDEPTSGVDPVARNQFWDHLTTLARQDQVTIFVSTHFMNEGERCDRISLMHAGRVLASGAPSEIAASHGKTNLEDAFIECLESAITDKPRSDSKPRKPVKERQQSNWAVGFQRLMAYTIRELLEVLRDPVRMIFSLLGSALLMMIMGYGISVDVNHLRFAVLDHDQSPESRQYIQNIAGSRYFIEQPPITSSAELDRRMASAEVSVALEIPPSFGKHLQQGRPVAIAAWVDGAMPFRGETIVGYVQGLHRDTLTQIARNTSISNPTLPAVDVEMRYRYNQDFKSLFAMVPAIIPILLVFIPAILTAVGVVREKELGSIANFYATPVSRLQFLLGKQLPYIAVSMVSFYALVLMSVFVFEVPIKGSIWVLSLAALLFVTATTGIGLVMSAFTKTQIAALTATAILTMLPTVNFSGLTDPVTSLTGAGAIIGQLFPATYFLNISRGIFTKALEWQDVANDMLAIAAFIPVLTITSVLLLQKQEK